MLRNLPIEIWCEICKYISPTKLWAVRASLNSNFYHAVRLSLYRYLQGLQSGTRPRIILRIEQNCNGNQSTIILVPEMSKPNDMFVSFTPFEVGFQGLGKLLSKIIEPLISDRINSCDNHNQDCQCQGEVKEFARQDFVKLTSFFKSRWNDFKDSLPGQIRNAYSVLFGHILNTLECLCQRPQQTMEVTLQMSVLLQTWRVIEILSSPGLKDPQIGCECGTGKSAFSEMSFHFERDFGDGEVDQRPLEFDFLDVQEVVDDLHWEWDQNSLSMRAVSAEFHGPNSLWRYPADFKIDAIRYGTDGFKNSLSISDVSLKIPLALLFGK